MNYILLNFPEEFEMNIFDRYGARVFHSIDPTLMWDGNPDNTQYQIGLYMIQVDYKMPYQGKKQILLTRVRLIK